MLAGQVYSTISCMLKSILFSPTICSLSEVGGFLDAEELHLSLCSISHSGIYGVYRARCFTHGPALYHGSPLALHPKHYATFQQLNVIHYSACLSLPCSRFSHTLFHKNFHSSSSHSACSSTGRRSRYHPIFSACSLLA